MQKKSNLFFQSLRNIVYFFKIIVILLVLLYFLYWIQHLTGDIWDWTKFTHSLFKFLVNFASKISSKSILLFDAEFNYSFFIVFIFFTLLYGLIVLIYDGINVLEENYNNFLRAIRKRQENSYNQGLSNGVYFYRDSNQNEVDILLKQEGEITALEIKSSMTYHNSFEKTLSKLSEWIKTPISKKAVIYAGDFENDKGEITIINYRNLHHILPTLL